MSTFGKQRAAERKARTTATNEGVTIGDIWIASGGHEQTDVWFFVVTELRGKTQMLVVPIGQRQAGAGHVVPRPDEIEDAPFRLKVSHEKYLQAWERSGNPSGLSAPWAAARSKTMMPWDGRPQRKSPEGEQYRGRK